MRLRILVVSAVLIAVAVPLAAALAAQAATGAAGFKGIVVAKQRQRGTLLIVGAHGAGLTVRGGLARAKVGQRVSGRIRFALEVPDLDAALERLLARGAKLVHPPIVTPWCHRNVRLEDPDGLQVTLFQVLDAAPDPKAG